VKFSKGVKGKIEKKIWVVLREIAWIRADGECEVCGEYGMCTGDGFQVDHCITSQCAKYRFDFRNLSWLCAPCHFKKTHCVSGVDLVVADTVRKREGSFYRKLVSYHKSQVPHKWELLQLESQLILVEEQLEYWTKRHE